MEFKATLLPNYLLVTPISSAGQLTVRKQGDARIENVNRTQKGNEGIQNRRSANQGVTAKLNSTVSAK